MKNILANMHFRQILGLLILLWGLYVLIFGLVSKIEVTRYTLQSGKLKNHLRIVQLSDTHSCQYGPAQEELLSLIREQKPDLILLTGDIIDDELPRDQGYELARVLPAIAPCYYVIGNHEAYTHEEAEIKARLQSFGLTVLAGEGVNCEIKGNSLLIMGLEDPYIGAAYDEQLARLQSLKSDKLSLLLAHRPERSADYASLHVDYVFAGHAHGGQWRFPLLLENGLFAPNQGLFPAYTRGVHEFKNFHLIISRGLSRESTRVPRIFNRPELVVVDFQAVN